MTVGGVRVIAMAMAVVVVLVVVVHMVHLCLVAMRKLTASSVWEAASVSGRAWMSDVDCL